MVTGISTYPLCWKNARSGFQRTLDRLYILPVAIAGRWRKDQSLYRQCLKIALNRRLFLSCGPKYVDVHEYGNEKASFEGQNLRSIQLVIAVVVGGKAERWLRGNI